MIAISRESEHMRVITSHEFSRLRRWPAVIAYIVTAGRTGPSTQKAVSGSAADVAFKMTFRINMSQELEFMIFWTMNNAIFLRRRGRWPAETAYVIFARGTGPSTF